jgi:hypothetical protein
VDPPWPKSRKTRLNASQGPRNGNREKRHPSRLLSWTSWDGGLGPNPPETRVPLTVSNLAGAPMSKNQPLPVDPLHQQPDAPGVDQDDAQIQKPKDDAFKKPPNDKGLGKAVKKG